MGELSEYLCMFNWYSHPEVFFNDLTKIIHPPDGYKRLDKQLKLFLSVKNRDNRIIMVAANNTGKTLSLALLSLYVTCVMSEIEGYPYKVLNVSGSWSQSNVLHSYIRQFLTIPIFKKRLVGESTATKIDWKNKGWIHSYTATETQVLGQHPDLVSLDEAALICDTIIEDSFSRVAGSKLGTIIMSGTPEIEHYFSKFVSIYENTADYPEWVRIRISATECPWIDYKKINEARNNLSKAKFEAKWMGIPGTDISGALFDSDKIRRNVRVKPEVCKFNEDSPSSMGVDFGFKAPTAITVAQQENDVWYVVYYEEHKEKPWDYIKNRLAVLADEYNVKVLHADAEDPWRIEELQNMKELQSVQIDPVHFRGEKDKMRFQLQGLIAKDKLKIPDIYSTMLRQLTMYREDTKNDDDAVDSLMLAVKTTLKSESDPWYFKADMY